MRYAVFGHPVSHSLSPKVHRLFAEQCGIAVQYDAIDASGASFHSALDDFFQAGGHGCNVTLPNKTLAYAYASTHTPAARHSGAANMLTKLAGGGVCADNTDGAGFILDLKNRCHLSLTGLRVLLVGAGGAARNCVHAILAQQPSELVICNRTLSRAEEVVELCQSPKVSAMSCLALATLGAFDCIVHASSMSAYRLVPDLPLSLVHQDTVVYDLFYDTQQTTTCLSWAMSAGAKRCFDGLGMLVEQAAIAFNHWHGHRPETQRILQQLRGKTT